MENSNSFTKPFTEVQQAFIKNGEKRNKMLREKVMHALGVLDLEADAYRHHYIVGGPGIGKTYTVNEVAFENDIELIRIQGVASMNAIVIQLAVASYLSENKQLRIWIDDCDSIFMDNNSLSVMKGVLDEDRNILAWNKNMTVAIGNFEKSDNKIDQLKAVALRHFQTVGGVGVEIPTDYMSFIITSNRYLTPSQPTPKTQRKMDESAIRDRINYQSYILDKDDSWGWMAATSLKANIFDISITQKHILLDWMYENWDNIPSTSMRFIRGLAADMVNHPNDYPDYWDARLEFKK